MPKRTIFTDDHETYRQTVREFIAREVLPHQEAWDEQKQIPLDLFPRAAAVGLYALQVPEEYGGAEEPDFRYRMVVNEEIGRANANSLAVTLTLQDDLFYSYPKTFATPEQMARWMPGFVAGERLGAIAMTEPEAGSDLRAMRTSAIRDGDSWVMNGQKTFISSGATADLIVVAARTEGVGRGYSLFMVEGDTPGLIRGRKLDKIGIAAQDTAELFFENCRIPAENLLGTAGDGLGYLMRNLPRERLGIASGAIGHARGIYELTVDYCKERTAFGQRIIDFQANRFELAEYATELDIAEAYVDACVLAYNAGELGDVDAAKAKWWCTELQKKIIDGCLQLHGGYGFMREYAVGRAFGDSRIQTIYGGTTAIMKEIIGREIAGSVS